jgi:hypothetical protein
VELETSVPCPQNPAAFWPYPELVDVVFTLTSRYLMVHRNIILPPSPLYPSVLFPLHECVSHLSRAWSLLSHFILIDLTTLIIYSEECRLCSYSSRSVFLSSCDFLFLRSEYSSADLALKHLQSILNNFSVRITFYLFGLMNPWFTEALAGLTPRCCVIQSGTILQLYVFFQIIQ